MTNTLNKVGFVSLGCSKNLVDTENMIGILAERGYEAVGDPSEADIIVVNTCGFIDSAKQESIDAILEMAQYKKTGMCRLLVAADAWHSVTPRTLKRSFRRLT